MSQIVTVEIREILPSGIRGYILDLDRFGIIRKKEFSWDKRFNAKLPNYQIGQLIEAKVISTQSLSSDIILSIREMEDPWENFSKESDISVDMPIVGIITGVRKFAAYAQVYPGVDAIIYPADVPMSSKGLLTNELFIGDRVKGIVLEFDPNRKRLHISLTRYLEHIYSDEVSPIKILTEDYVSVSDPVPGKLSSDIVRAPVKDREPDQVVLLDDSPNSIEQIAAALEANFEIIPQKQTSVEDFWENFETNLLKNYTLFIIDIELDNGYNGLEIAQEIHDKAIESELIVFVLVTSDNPQPPSDLPFSFVPKLKEEIVSYMRQTYNVSTPEDYVKRTLKFSNTGNFLQQLGMVAYTREPIERTLSTMIEQLIEETNFTYGFVLEIDTLLQEVEIVSHFPPIDSNHIALMRDGLFYSPVQDLTVDNYFIMDVKKNDHETRYKNFFRLLNYKAWVGISLEIPDVRRKYTLFCLDEKRFEIPKDDEDQIKSAATLFKLALERNLIINYMRRFEQRYSEGLLLGTLVHELLNRMDGVTGSLKKVQNSFPNIEKADLTQLSGILDELKSLINAYSSLVSTALVEINIRNIVQKIMVRFSTRQQNNGIRINIKSKLKSDDKLVLNGIETHLEQIIFNIILNAKQQVEAHYQKLNERSSLSHNVTANRQIVIEIVWDNDSSYPLKIYIYDTGPGIHFHKWGDIFLLDISSRDKGHGLGLFISQTLAGWMGARIRIADSIMFVGSKFVVEFPAS